MIVGPILPPPIQPRKPLVVQDGVEGHFTGTELHTVCRVLGGGYARARCVDATPRDARRASDSEGKWQAKK
jgi:hypothetical protein